MNINKDTCIPCLKFPSRRARNARASSQDLLPCLSGVAWRGHSTGSGTQTWGHGGGWWRGTVVVQIILSRTTTNNSEKKWLDCQVMVSYSLISPSPWDITRRSPCWITGNLCKAIRMAEPLQMSATRSPYSVPVKGQTNDAPVPSSILKTRLMICFKQARTMQRSRSIAVVALVILVNGKLNFQVRNDLLKASNIRFRPSEKGYISTAGDWVDAISLVVRLGTPPLAFLIVVRSDFEGKYFPVGIIISGEWALA